MKVQVLFIFACVCLHSCLGSGWHALFEYSNPDCKGLGTATLTKTTTGYKSSTCTSILNKNDPWGNYALTGCQDTGNTLVETFAISTSPTCDSISIEYNAPFGSCVTVNASYSYATQCTLDGGYNAEFLRYLNYTRASIYHDDNDCSKDHVVKVVIESTTDSDPACTSITRPLVYSTCQIENGLSVNKMCGPVTDLFYTLQRFYNPASWGTYGTYVIQSNFSDSSCQQSAAGISGHVLNYKAPGICMKDPSSDNYIQAMCGPKSGYQVDGGIYSSPNADCSKSTMISNNTEAVCLQGSTGASITSCTTMVHPSVSETFFNGLGLVAGLVVFANGIACDTKMSQIEKFTLQPVKNCSDFIPPKTIGPKNWPVPGMDTCFKYQESYEVAASFYLYVCDTPQNIFTTKMGFSIKPAAVGAGPSVPNPIPTSEPTNPPSNPNPNPSSNPTNPNPSSNPTNPPASDPNPTEPAATSSSPSLFASPFLVLALAVFAWFF